MNPACRKEPSPFYWHQLCSFPGAPCWQNPLWKLLTKQKYDLVPASAPQNKEGNNEKVEAERDNSFIMVYSSWEEEEHFERYVELSHRCYRLLNNYYVPKHGIKHFKSISSFNLVLKQPFEVDIISSFHVNKLRFKKFQ